MNRNPRLYAITTLAAVGLAAAGARAQEDAIATPGPADLVVHNAIVHTLDPTAPRARALAARDGRLVFVGDDAGALALRGEGTRVLDLGGATVLPGLIDAHAHLLGLGKTLQSLDLVGTTSVEQVGDRVREACERAAPGAWIYGRGWDQNDWPDARFPTADELPDCGDHPVYLARIDGHAYWVNRLALERAGIEAGTRDPDGGRIERDSSGAPTGVLIDRAADLVRAAVPEPSPQTLRDRALLAQEACLRVGLTGVVDAGVDREGLNAYHALANEGQLRIRVSAMLDDEDGELVDAYLSQPPLVGLYDDHLSLRAIKLYADGALGSRGAALLAPYSDDPENHGWLVSGPDYLEEMTRKALSAGWQVATHAIGDRANRTVLDAYERALAGVPGGDYRLRIEHAQVLAPEDIPRFVSLGVIPSMQPTHATSDMPWAGARLGPDRLAGAYAWRSLLNTGVRLPLGSDFPVESPAPLWGIYAAVTRQDHAGQPVGGWLPGQRLTLTEAVRGFTLDAAYSTFDEGLKGSLEEGKLADLVVLSADPFTVAPAEILEIEVRMTVVGGEVVYEGGDAGGDGAR